MTIALISVSILAFLFFVLLIIRRYKDKIERNDLSIWVDITTILIGVASLIVSGISISVMLSQEKTEKFLLEAQKKEHQPVFSIGYTLSKSPTSEVYDVEDFVIENIGEQILSPASISHKTFLKIDYRDIANNSQKSIYYPLTYYYNATISSDDQIGRLLTTIGNEYLHNNLKLYELDKAAIAFNNEYDKEYIFIEKVDLFKITYTDIYNEERVNHYRNSHLCTKELYESIFQNAASVCAMPGIKSISDVTFKDILIAVKNNH